jgi:ATP-dependent helicase/DNAse subunit B
MPWKSYQKSLIRGLENNRSTGLLKEILKREIDADTIPAFFEWSFGKFKQDIKDTTDPNRNEQNFILKSSDKIPSLLSLPDTSLEIRGKIDRIDFLLEDFEEREKSKDNGPVRIEVCDYKTGYHSAKKEVEQGTAYQLPLYLLAAMELLPKELGPYNPGRAVYYELKKLSEVEKKTLLGAKPRGRQKDNMYEYLTLVQSHILEDLKSIEAGYFYTTTDPQSIAERGYCNYCPAYSICSANPIFTASIQQEFQQKIILRKENLLKERENFLKENLS